MTFAGIAKSSLVDFPGLVSCVLFTPGCNYDCWFCHNRQLIDGTHEDIGFDAVMEFLKKRAGLLDGVVLTGGEPALQPDLPAFMRELRALGYQLKLDTNGSSPETIEAILDEGLCDYFAVDYKAPKHMYPVVCRGGADAESVLRTIRLLFERCARFEVRTTVFPQLRESDLLRMAQELPVLPRYALNRYRKPDKYLPEDAALVSETPYSAEQIAALAEKMRPWQPNIIV